MEGIAGGQQLRMWETWAEVKRVGVVPRPQLTGQRGAAGEAWVGNWPEADSLSKPYF